MIFLQWQLQLVSLIISYIYIYLEKKILTKKLESFYNTYSFCEFGTHSIVFIKYDVIAIICDNSVIQCDINTFRFIYIKFK
jgi:hypothetical protein